MTFIYGFLRMNFEKTFVLGRNNVLFGILYYPKYGDHISIKNEKCYTFKLLGHINDRRFYLWNLMM